MKKAKHNFTVRLGGDDLTWIESETRRTNQSAGAVIRAALNSASARSDILQMLNTLDSKIEAVGKLTHKIFLKVSGKEAAE